MFGVLALLIAAAIALFLSSHAAKKTLALTEPANADEEAAAREVLDQVPEGAPAAAPRSLQALEGARGLKQEGDAHARQVDQVMQSE